jgi:hypothetical protein
MGEATEDEICMLILGGLHERHASETWNLCTNSPFALRTEELKPKLVFVTFKNSVRTSKRTPHFTITKINCLMLFKKVIDI